MELEERESPLSLSPSPIGRVMSVLLASRHRHLEAAVNRLGIAPSRSASGSHLDESLCFLWRHVQSAVEKGDGLDEVLVPMMEHLLLFKEPKHNKEVLTLVGWLFKNEHFANTISHHLVEILKKKEDHYIALGWCKLVIVLVEGLFNMNSDDGKCEHEVVLLRILWLSISDLACIVCNESIDNGGFELPTRLAVASADCMLVLFEALMKRSVFSAIATGKWTGNLNSQNQPLLSELYTKSDKGQKYINSQPLQEVNMEIGCLLWNNLNMLTILIEKLKAWSEKSQPLHARGLGQLQKWLSSIKLHYDSLEDEAGVEMQKSGLLLLCSCWKHYGGFLRLNDVRCILNHKEMLEQLLAALQFYTNEEAVSSGEPESRIETRRFFLNCMALLLGRLRGKHLQNVISQYGDELLPLLFSQVNDRDLVEGAIGIIRDTFIAGNSSHGGYVLDSVQMEYLLSLLLKFLREHSEAPVAVVELAAECCSLDPEGRGLEKILECFEEGSDIQKRNALEVVSAVVGMNSECTLPSAVRERTSKFLIECLRQSLIPRFTEVSILFPKLDATIVLPELLFLVSSKDENVRSPASEALISTINCHNEDFSTFFMTLKFLSDFIPTEKSSLGPEKTCNFPHKQTGLKLDVDHVLGLLFKSSESIENWQLFIDKLIEKMFSDPSNAIIVRLMSHLSDHLAEVADLVFHRVRIYMCSKKLENNRLIAEHDSVCNSDSHSRSRDALFSCLCPLLLLRVLPLRAFDNLLSSDMYGHGIESSIQEGLYSNRSNCIAAILVSRAFRSSEYDDVRKLSAELCGRLHPQVLLPVIANHLDDAVGKCDMLTIKACLFALCTSLVARGMLNCGEDMIRIRNSIDLVLSWPSVDSDEVSKAQHGCIDCLALMICAELKTSGLSADDVTKCQSTAIREGSSTNNIFRESVVEMVIQRLTCEDVSPFSWRSMGISISENASNASFQNKEAAPHMSSTVPFRLCMANALISAYQKVPDSSRSLLSYRTLPALISGVEEVTTSEVRAACLQVLFSAIYNLKSAILPFAPKLLKLALKVLKHGSDKEKLAATKLMASLMASDDEIVSSISAGLLEAKSILLKVSSSASSGELRKMSKQLLACMISPSKFNPL